MQPPRRQRILPTATQETQERGMRKCRPEAMLHGEDLYCRDGEAEPRSEYTRSLGKQVTAARDAG